MALTGESGQAQLAADEAHCAVSIIACRMRHFAALLLLFALLTAAPVVSQPNNCTEQTYVPLIFGGEEAPKGRFPYACSLRTISDADHFCGCVLVDKRHVLTAAHCVDGDFEGAHPDPLVYIGLHDRDNADGSGEVSTVAVTGGRSLPGKQEMTIDTKPFLHPDWNGVLTDGNDVAVLRLSEKSDKTPISLPPVENDIRPGTRLLAVGFGDVSEASGIQSAESLQILYDLTYISRSACNRYPSYDGVLTERTFCGESSTGDTSRGLYVFHDCPHCRSLAGDSGGPVFIPHRFDDIEAGKPKLDRLIGITSFSVGGTKAAPGTYARVSSFRLWIDCIIADGEEESCRRPTTGSSRDSAEVYSQPVLNSGEVLRPAPRHRDPDCNLAFGRGEQTLSESQTSCLGGTALTPPKCVYWEEVDEVDCFYRGTDSAIHRMRIKDSLVEEIENLGGAAMTGVECVITAPRSLTCIIVGDDNALWVRELKNNRWGEQWESLGGRVDDIPSCVSHSGGQIDCVGRNVDGELYHVQSHPDEFDWRPFRDFTSRPVRRPMLFYNKEGDKAFLSAYYWAPEEDEANFRYYDISSDTWDAPREMSVFTFLESLSRVEWSNQTTYFYKNHNGHVVYFVDTSARRRYSSSYSPKYSSIPRRVYSWPECVSTKNHTTDCFALTPGRILSQSVWEKGSWSSWKLLGGPLMEAPTCIAVPDKQIRCYARSYTLSVAEIIIDK